MSVCWNAVFSMYSTSYPFFWLPLCKRFDLTCPGFCKSNFWINTRKLCSSLKLHKICVAHLWKRFWLRLHKPRKKPFLCASHFFKSNLEMQTVQAVGASKIGRPLQKTRQNFTWTNKRATRYSAQRIPQDICRIFGRWILSGFLLFQLTGMVLPSYC